MLPWLTDTHKNPDIEMFKCLTAWISSTDYCFIKSQVHCLFDSKMIRLSRNNWKENSRKQNKARIHTKSCRFTKRFRMVKKKYFLELQIIQYLIVFLLQLFLWIYDVFRFWSQFLVCMIFMDLNVFSLHFSNPLKNGAKFLINVQITRIQENRLL